MPKNECYTYFRIVGNFDPREITRRLKIKPYRTRALGEAPEGVPEDFAIWEASRVDEYDVYTDVMMEKTLLPFYTKVEELLALKRDFGVDYSLVVVPKIYAENSTPTLAPTLDIMDFCHAARCEIDIDLYDMDEVGEDYDDD